MVILGIDPGTATTGYAILSIQKDTYNAVDWGLIETDKNEKHGRRFIDIYQKTKSIISKHNPDAFVIETLFFATNAKTAIRVGQAQGVLIYCAAKHQLPVFEYAPGTIKKIITGSGRADKKLIQQSLRKIFGNKIRSRKNKKTHFDNAADALAVALCHALSLKNSV